MDTSTAYQCTLSWLYALEAAKGMDFKLDRVARALERLGDPHRKFASIHVAGTNGKGSVAAMLHAVLSAGGYRVGLYTSPHLVRFTERIRVGEREIDEAQVVAIADQIRRITAGIDLTFFELGTVMAFVHFAQSNVDVAVIEVGLGGRLDATNVIDPLISVITTIGLDHTEFLGDTIEAVAAEKGGIIKPGVPLVIGRLPSEAESVLRKIATERGAAVAAWGRDFSAAVATDGIVFRGCKWSFAQLELALRGEHQIENMATALAVLERLPANLCVTPDAARAGLSRVRWPGRWEQVRANPAVFLDGAHNLDGTRALVRELRAVAGERRVHVLFAVMRDKPWAEMTDLLGPLCASAVVTEVLPPRGAPAAEVAEVWKRYCPTAVEPDPTVAWDRISSCAKQGDLVVVTGSLFLIGAVYPLCRGGWDDGDRREVGSGMP